MTGAPLSISIQVHGSKPAVIKDITTHTRPINSARPLLFFVYLNLFLAKNNMNWQK